MNSSFTTLSKAERALLKGMTDFGVPLYEVLWIVKESIPTGTDDDQLNLAKDLILGLIDKELVAFCKLNQTNTKSYVYEVDDSTAMSVEEVIQHMSVPSNWEQCTFKADGITTYELAPTSEGETVLDCLFGIENGN